MEETTAPMKAERVQSRLRRLPGWGLGADGKAICRTYEFPSFPAAIRFVDFVAELAEAQGHHPDIDIRYTRVRLQLSTHDAGGITEKDFRLAEGIDQR